MNITNPASTALRSFTAMTLAVVFSVTCVMAAVAPSATQSVDAAGAVIEAPVA